MRRYVIRLDDACPTLRRIPWGRVERALVELDVEPIVGIIPECRDPALRYDQPDPDFWDRAGAWQERGWTIALHGLHHVLGEIPRGVRNLVPLNPMTEFAGLEPERQTEMIREGVSILHARGVSPTVWMAPAHSMDHATLRALKEGSQIRRITDGLALAPYEEHGFVWLPQQLWQLPTNRDGIWTVCVHPSVLTDAELDAFIESLHTHRDELCRDLEPVFAEGRGRARSVADKAFATGFLAKRDLLHRASRVKRSLFGPR